MGFPLHVGTLYQELDPFSSSAIWPKVSARKLLVPLLSSLITHQAKKKRLFTVSYSKARKRCSAKPERGPLRRNVQVEDQAQMQKLMQSPNVAQSAGMSKLKAKINAKSGASPNVAQSAGMSKL